MTSKILDYSTYLPMSIGLCKIAKPQAYTFSCGFECDVPNLHIIMCVSGSSHAVPQVIF